MTDDSGVEHNAGAAQASLQTLAGYLERALDRATSVVLTRPSADVCLVYLGDPSGLPEDLKQVGTMATSMANAILESTNSGANHMQIGDETYRFVRTFTQIGDEAAVVFSAD
ncbi:hypothetical protein P3T18_006020 [Paraburkholderia sp. GAS199]|uniref:hypothetical protein n=1 Tax=Paraburkholderia sp. GAS199 TaxID=3035126 RepID=UPI003D1F1627